MASIRYSTYVCIYHMCVINTPLRSSNYLAYNYLKENNSEPLNFSWLVSLWGLATVAQRFSAEQDSTKRLTVRTTAKTTDF